MRFVAPSTIRGTVAAPPSKSMTGRVLAASLLASGVSEIGRPSLCDDGIAARRIIGDLGAGTEERGATLLVRGRGREGLACERGALDCGESGLAMRMFAPIAALLAARTTLLASGSLRSRPMAMIECLNLLGASCITKNGLPPVVVEGPMKGGWARIDGSVSSQVVSGLLMALPLCEKTSVLRVSNLVSAPYVRMTVETLRLFGVRIDHDEASGEFVIEGNQAYSPVRYEVEGDWSGAAFLLVAGAIAGSVTVEGLDTASPQADRAILDVLSEAGARVEAGGRSVSVEAQCLRPFRFDASACPDLFPPLVALASALPGKSVIGGIGRLVHKESNRASALCEEFGKMGIDIHEAGDVMEIRGGRAAGGLVDSHNDHRITMACAVAALRAKGKVAITGSSCVSKSYPAFFADLAALAGGP